jgi:hypothetical protein
MLGPMYWVSQHAAASAQVYMPVKGVCTYMRNICLYRVFVLLADTRYPFPHLMPLAHSVTQHKVCQPPIWQQVVAKQRLTVVGTCSGGRQQA